MERPSKVLVAAAVLLALPLVLGVYKRYSPAMHNPLVASQDVAERESIKGYVREQFCDHIKVQDELTTTEVRSELGKGISDVSVDMSVDTSSGTRVYTVGATLTRNGKVRGTANGAATVESSDGAAPVLRYDLRFQYYE